jgi:hypothetical protein
MQFVVSAKASSPKGDEVLAEEQLAWRQGVDLRAQDLKAMGWLSRRKLLSSCLGSSD